MDFGDRSCQHLSQIEDFHEGCVICSLCGLVLSPLFMDQITQISSLNSHYSPAENLNLAEIKNLLDRVHISTSFATQIDSYFQTNFITKSKQALVYSMFKILNELGISISMKEISQAFNISKKMLHRAQSVNDIIKIDFLDIVEKYGRLLNLNFETITLIKEEMRNKPTSGHNPNSVLASTIYQVCKKTKQHVSIKKVSEVTQVSCVSIQRYNKFLNLNKHDCSQRRQIPKG